MEYDALRDRLADVVFTTATPFAETGAVDRDALARNVSALADAGARAFLACGNTGEYDALTDAERVAVVETHVEALTADTATDRRETTVLGGVGGSTARAVELAQAYAAAGADGLVAMHPTFTYSHAAGLREHYRAIAGATDLGLVLYTRGPGVPRRVIAELAGDDAVVGVKFARADTAEFAATKRAVADASPDADLAWLTGAAERYALAFDAEGADGYTTGLGNFAPRATLALFDALASDERDRARELRDLLFPIEALRQETGPENPLAAANNVPVVKAGMNARGYEGGTVRPPLVELSGEDERRLATVLDRLADAGF